MEQFAGLAVSSPCGEDMEQGGLELLDGKAVKNLAADGFLVAEAASDEDVVTFAGFTGDFHLGSQEADIANVMLGAGMGTAGEVDIDGLVEIDFLF